MTGGETLAGKRLEGNFLRRGRATGSTPIAKSAPIGEGGGLSALCQLGPLVLGRCPRLGWRRAFGPPEHPAMSPAFAPFGFGPLALPSIQPCHPHSPPLALGHWPSRASSRVTRIRPLWLWAIGPPEHPAMSPAFTPLWLGDIGPLRHNRKSLAGQFTEPMMPGASANGALSSQPGATPQVS